MLKRKCIASLVATSLVFANGCQLKSIALEIEANYTNLRSNVSITATLKQQQALEDTYNMLLDYADVIGNDAVAVSVAADAPV